MASFTGRSPFEEGSTDSVAGSVRCVVAAESVRCVVTSARIRCVVAAGRSGGGSPGNTSAIALPFLSSNSTEAEKNETSGQKKRNEEIRKIKERVERRLNRDRENEKEMCQDSCNTGHRSDGPKSSCSPIVKQLADK
jgi:hypothetical protein